MTTATRAPYPGELRVYGGPEQLATAAADLFANVAVQSIRERGRFRAALSGGSTPRRVYELLAADRMRQRIDWNHTDLFWGDERYVPAQDRDSNYRMASETLLRHVPIPEDNVHRVPTEISPPAAAASAYEATIRQTFAGLLFLFPAAVRPDLSRTGRQRPYRVVVSTLPLASGSLAAGGSRLCGRGKYLAHQHDRSLAESRTHGSFSHRRRAEGAGAARSVAGAA